MLIRALTRACGRLTFEPDQILDVDDADGIELLAAGAAVQIKSSVEIVETGEVADSQKPSKSKKG